MEQTKLQYDNYKELIELANDVIPKTWNVYEYCDIKNYKKKRGILNVELHIYDNPEYYIPSIKKVRGIIHTGHVRCIRYFNGVGHVKINIHCYPLHRPDTLLHELAHVAVFRLQSLITKTYKAEYELCGGDIIEPDSHGKIFIRLLNIIENRAIKKGWVFFVIKDTKIWSKDKESDKEADRPEREDHPDRP